MRKCPSPDMGFLPHYCATQSQRTGKYCFLYEMPAHHEEVAHQQSKHAETGIRHYSTITKESTILMMLQP